MPTKTTGRQSASCRVSREAKRLLELMAQRASLSQSEVLEQAIREKALRDEVAMASPAADEASPPVSGLTPDEATAVQELRELAQKIRAGEAVASDETRRWADVLRAAIPITPAARSGPMSPEERDHIQGMIGELRTAIPDEWSEEELIERVNQVVHDVRAERRAWDDRPHAEPASPQQQALLAAFQEMVQAGRERFAGMSREEIDREVEQAVAEARMSQHARGH